MRTHGVKIVEVPLITYRCDAPGCSEERTLEHGQSRARSGMFQCDICGHDCCRKHTVWFEESSANDSPDFTCCHVCQPELTEAWNWALERAGRHDSIEDVTRARLKEMRLSTSGDGK